MKNLFVSYAKEDREIATEIAASLENEGFSVFIDKTDLAAGDNIHGKIYREINKAHGVVVLLSPSSVAKEGYVTRELDVISKRWRRPVGRVFPVIVRPLDWNLIPGYLRAAPILDPGGAFAGAVVHALKDRVSVGRRTLILAASIAILSLATGVLIGHYLLPRPEPPLTNIVKPEPPKKSIPVAMWKCETFLMIDRGSKTAFNGDNLWEQVSYNDGFSIYWKQVKSDAGGVELQHPDENVRCIINDNLFKMIRNDTANKPEEVEGKWVRKPAMLDSL